MTLLPIPLPKAIEDALRDILKPSAEKIKAGLLTLVESGLRGRRKSLEEIELDRIEGQSAAYSRQMAARQRLQEIASNPNDEYQRVLAREAILCVPEDRFVMPALSIAGKIFRDSEFDQSEAPIWEMWVQLLARACDKERVGDAHPSFPWIISQLSSDEAKILSSLALLKPRQDTSSEPIPVIDSAKIGVTFRDNISFYMAHLGNLGLVCLPRGWEPTGHVVMIDNIRTYMLSEFGRSFILAVSRSP